MRYFLFCCMMGSLFSVPAFAQQSLHERCLDYLAQHDISPSAYVVSKFKQYDIVLLAEDHGIKQNLDFVAALIPQLYNNGVYNICMEFGAQEMQAKMDSLLSADTYDPVLAREMMYYYNVGWAYKEYYDLCDSVWRFNKTLPESAPKFRIVNMSYRYDWSVYKGGQRTPENMQQVFMRGTPDQFRADIVEQEVLNRKQKALVLTGVIHAYTKYKLSAFHFSNDNFIAYDDNSLGNRLYKKYPSQVTSLLFHSPFWNKPNKQPYIIPPANGSIDALMARRNNRPVGFDLINTPLGELPDSSAPSLGYPGFTMGKLFDGYIFLVPFHEMQGCTIDTSFFDGKNWEAIKTQVPDPDWRGQLNDLQEFWKQIKDFADIKKRYRDLLR